MARQVDLPAHLLEAVRQVNEAQKRVLVRKVQKHYGSYLKEKTLAVWGLAFKPRTDDIREAPALVLIDAMLAAGVKLRVHDPEAAPNVKAIYGNKLVYCDKPYGALEDSDGLAIVTEWKEFHKPDFEVMRRLLREKVIFDGRNLYEPKIPASFGFTYYVGSTVSGSGTSTAPTDAGTYTVVADFTSSDPTATLPPDFVFAAADNGTISFMATLNFPGSQSITATDTVTSTITGSGTLTLMIPTAPNTLTVTSTGDAGPDGTISLRQAIELAGTIERYRSR